MANTTIVMMPDRWSPSAMIHTAKVETNCTMTAVAMSFMGTNAWVSSKTEPLVIQAKAAQAARDDR